ncbi:hypothetical protein D9M72_561620 [compost metagenome]
MGADVGAEEFEDQVGKPVDDRRLLLKARCRGHHAEHARPCGDAVQVAERALQAAEHREPGEARGGVALLDGQLGAELAERRGNAAVGIQRAVARDDGASADEADEREGEEDAGRWRDRRGQHEAECCESLFDAGHGVALLQADVDEEVRRILPWPSGAAGAQPSAG